MQSVSGALRTLPLLLLALSVAACGDDASGPEDDARVQVLLTDAPADVIASAEVWISRVYLVPGEDEESEEGEGGGFEDLFNDPENPQHFDLLELQGGNVADLTGVTEVPEGTYHQLRLVVDRALVTLKEDYTFNDGTTEKELFVPSGSRSGIKVLLDEPVEAEEGTTTVMTVDFDVEQNFKIQGNPDTPAGIHGILFTPVLKEMARNEEEGEGA